MSRFGSFKGHVLARARADFNGNEWMDLVQWPAMVVTIAASWLVASSEEHKRGWGFWVFLASNVLWVIWGLHAKAYALVVLQIGLAVMNIRGTRKNDPEAPA